MKRTRGFTLVELLCVIALTVIILVLLMETSVDLKPHSLVVKCASNMHEITIAMVGYAVDNHDYWPLYYGLEGYPITTQAVPSGRLRSNSGVQPGFSPWTSGGMYDASCTVLGVSASGPSGQYYNIGALIKNGYLGTSPVSLAPGAPLPFAKVAYDPAVSQGMFAPKNANGYAGYFMNPHWAYAGSNEAYVCSTDSGSNTVQMALQSRPPVAPGIVSPPYLVAAYQKTAQTPGNRCVLMDAIYSVATIEHRTTPTPIFNVAFRDAHVVSVSLPPQVYAYLQTVSPEFAWAVPQSGGIATGAAAYTPGVTPPQTGTWPVNAGTSPPILSPSQLKYVQPGATPNGTTVLNYAVGLTNYTDLLERLGCMANVMTRPDGTPTPPNDPYFMMTGLRSGAAKMPAN